jgi:hypothetical protein
LSIDLLGIGWLNYDGLDFLAPAFRGEPRNKVPADLTLGRLFVVEEFNWESEPGAITKLFKLEKLYALAATECAL